MQLKLWVHLFGSIVFYKYEMHQFVMGSRTDANTRAGMEYAASGRRTAYWFWQVHPALQVQERSVGVEAGERCTSFVN
jgi:hypothetical protein